MAGVNELDGLRGRCGPWADVDPVGDVEAPPGPSSSGNTRTTYRQWLNDNAIPAAAAAGNRAELRQAGVPDEDATDIDEDEWMDLTNLPCFYCAYTPGENERVGLDRCNPGGPYKKADVVPCCKSCNKLKSCSTVRQFIWWIAQGLLEHAPHLKRTLRVIDAANPGLNLARRVVAFWKGQHPDWRGGWRAWEDHAAAEPSSRISPADANEHEAGHQQGDPDDPDVHEGWVYHNDVDAGWLPLNQEAREQLANINPGDLARGRALVDVEEVARPWASGISPPTYGEHTFCT